MIRAYSDTPRILAIDDIHLKVSPSRSSEMIGFYVDLIGLDQMPDIAKEESIAFRGYPRSGPKLIISLMEDSPEAFIPRKIPIQVSDLSLYAEQLMERRLAYYWQRGLFYYDRRLSTYDPGGNLVEFVAYHRF